MIDAASLERRLAEAFRGEFGIRGVLGVGGFAAVFAAHDPVLQRDVAIKVIDISGLPHQDSPDRFLAEARVVATVEHPHIVPLYRAEVRDGLLCLTMRLVPGRSLGQLIAQGPLPPEEAARIAAEVALALAAAHARGIVHRDVKPENILLDANGHTIVTDFGISLVTGRANTRVPGLVIGTPQYLSPEQALGEEVDGRADVYSLGIVLYEMLAGRLPFESRTTSGLLTKQILEAPPPLDRFRPDLPVALATATSRALTKAAASRPTAVEFAAELSEARTRQALLPPSVIKRRRRWRRFRWAAGAIIVVTGALGFAGWTAYFGWTTFTGGALPALSAEGANIPPDLIAAMRADGSLGPGERPVYAFVPSGSDWPEAMIVTDRAILRRSPTGVRRHPTGESAVLNINYYRKGADRGLIVRVGGNQPDTLYRGLSGAELGALSAGLRAVTAPGAARERAP